MSAIMNDGDLLLQATVPRFATATDRALILQATANSFQVPASGVGSPASIDFAATLLNMTGSVSFAASGGSVLTRVGNVATMTFNAMVGNSVTVTASIVVDGFTYTATQTFNKAFDGITGNSSRTCYSKTTLGSLSSSPTSLTTSGAASFPPPDTWGTGTAWAGSPQALVAGESLYQSDGIYNPASGTTSWTAPYLSSLRVGSLSAITATLGAVTAGDITATTIHGGAGYPTSAYAWPNGAGGGIGYHLSSSGLRFGDWNNGAAGAQYCEISPNGRFFAPGLIMENGSATFSGKLSAASGSFAGNVVTGTGTGFRVEMGPDDPVYALWAGSGDKTDVNAVFYLKKTGAGYFGGSLSAGTLRTAVTNPSLDANAQIVDGPFGSNGGTINVICSYNYDEGGTSTKSTYTASGTDSVTISLYRTIAGGAEALVQSATYSGVTTISNDAGAGESSEYSTTMSGSFTYSDTAHSTANRTYRAVISSRSTKAIALHDKGTGGSDNAVIAGQTITIITTE